MTEITTRTHCFLRRHGMHPDLLDMPAELAEFRADMERGLTGASVPNGCQMLPAFVSPGRRPPAGEKVLTLDAGGTNLRAALVSFSEDGPRIEGLRTRPLPGLGTPISKADFLREIAEFSAPLAEASDRLGFCFSYPAEILPNGDGKVIRFTKEIRVNGSEGMLVCRELLDTFVSLGIKAPTVHALVNDTVAAMLGGYAQYPAPCDGMLCLILGTGTNICYLASVAHITRPIPGWSFPSMVINMESGTYSGFPQGTFDREVDAASASPGSYGNEKMVGGVYQGEVLRRTLIGAAEELFSPGFAGRLAAAGNLTAADLSAFLDAPQEDHVLSSLCVTDEDRAAMEVIVRCLLERAAKLVVLALAGPMEAEDMGKTAPALIVAEGSTFWKNRTLHRMIEAEANRFLTERLGRKYLFFGAEQPNLIGAALAAFRS